MTDTQFNALVARLETFARNQPGRYRLRVLALALAGDVYLWFVLLALLATVGASIWFLADLKFLAAKLIVVLAPIAWLLGKALWVSAQPPEGVAVTRDGAPELFDLIDDIRNKIGAPRFHHVLIDGDFNAGVVQMPRLGVFGWFRNYLIIGLPLLKTLTPEQFKGVLAHEYGHLAGGHGKLSNWIYRQRLRWSRLLASLEARGGDGGMLFMGFLKRYAPYLNAYSFPLARANEYEADAVAARVSVPVAMAQALTAVNVAGRYLAETYWPGVYREANHLPVPSKGPYVAFSDQLQSDTASMPHALWLDNAMKEKTSTADTHPSLADRLLAIGAVPELALPAPGKAADCLLGTSLQSVTERLDARWSTTVADGWRARFQQASEERETLAALQARVDVGESLPPDEAFSHALLLDNAAGDLPASIKALQALLEASPDDNRVAIALGTRLLFNGDEAGVPLLNNVIGRDVTNAIPCGQAIYDFYRRVGRLDEASAIAERVNALADQNRDADVERSAVLPTDVFVHHGLSSDFVAQLQRQLANVPEVRDAYLVQKQCQHQPERRHYVLGFAISNSWTGGRERKIGAAMASIRAQVQFPGETSIIPFDLGNEAYRKRLAAVTGSKLTV